MSMVYGTSDQISHPFYPVLPPYLIWQIWPDGHWCWLGPHGISMSMVDGISGQVSHFSCSPPPPCMINLVGWLLVLTWDNWSSWYINVPIWHLRSGVPSVPSPHVGMFVKMVISQLLIKIKIQCWAYMKGPWEHFLIFWVWLSWQLFPGNHKCKRAWKSSKHENQVMAVIGTWSKSQQDFQYQNTR